MAAPIIGSNWKRTLLELQEGWDLVNAKRISAKAIAAVDETSVVPCSDGGLQLEIHRDGFDIEIEISEEGKITGARVCAERIA